MRHQGVNDREGYDLIDLAAIWPRPDTGMQVPIGELEPGLATRPQTAVPDVPPAVGKLIVGAYAGLILACAATMARGGEASFAIAISALYVVIFLAVPRIFLAVENDRSRRPSLGRFMADGIETQTGDISGASALAQMLIVPALVTVAIVVIGAASLVLLP